MISTPEIIFNAAYDAGVKAMEEATPKVVYFKDMRTGEVFEEPEGLCGFAWVKIKGNSAFGRAMKKAGHFNKAWDTGLDYWVSGGNQSIERKEAFAFAFAKVLRDAGIEARVGSRYD